jgi:hypothetical protein
LYRYKKNICFNSDSWPDKLLYDETIFRKFNRRRRRRPVITLLSSPPSKKTCHKTYSDQKKSPKKFAYPQKLSVYLQRQNKFIIGATERLPIIQGFFYALV